MKCLLEPWPLETLSDVIMIVLKSLMMVDPFWEIPLIEGASLGANSLSCFSYLHYRSIARDVPDRSWTGNNIAMQNIGPRTATAMPDIYASKEITNSSCGFANPALINI